MFPRVVPARLPRAGSGARAAPQGAARSFVGSENPSAPYDQETGPKRARASRAPRTLERQSAMNVGNLNKDLEGEVRFASPRFVQRIWFQAIEHEDGAGKDAPSHRIVASDGGNTIELGAAWPKVKDGRRYFSCQIDQPGFDKPLSFAAFPRKIEAEGYDLSWSRPKGQR
jgi:uncharacterized protein (DUF736 family)